MSNHRLLTASGTLVDISAPDPAQIRIWDIAHALSRICRFGGHIAEYPYSVAQHSSMVSELCPPDLALAGLLHDAAEAYLGDLATPVKHLVPGFSALEERWQLAIGARFGLGDALARQPDDVKTVDARMLATERRDLMAANAQWKPEAEPFQFRIRAMDAPHAKDAFLARFGLLYGGK